MIYVDELRTYLKVNPEAQKHGQKWCHLWADSLEELIEFAKEINLNIKGLQEGDTFNHFDLIPSKRALAIENGAKIQPLRIWLKEKNLQKSPTTL